MSSREVLDFGPGFGEAAAERYPAAAVPLPAKRGRLEALLDATVTLPGDA
jgi:hypothetical protein